MSTWHCTKILNFNVNNRGCIASNALKKTKYNGLSFVNIFESYVLIYENNNGNYPISNIAFVEHNDIFISKQRYSNLPLSKNCRETCNVYFEGYKNIKCFYEKRDVS